MSEKIAVAIGADHAGVGLKAALRHVLAEAGHEVLDFGTEGTASVDYPDFAQAVCRAVTEGRVRFGVLVCGTGIGMSIAANRYRGIRCALAHDAISARLGRAHNNANVLALGARLLDEEVAAEALRVFLATPFEGGRHDRRLSKIETA